MHHRTLALLLASALIATPTLAQRAIGTWGSAAPTAPAPPL